MQISGKMQQYKEQLSNAIKVEHTKVAPMRGDKVSDQLTAGRIFEGTILEKKDGQVTLGLGDGQTISAKLWTDQNFQVGQSLFFQVKSNEGMRIQITPYAENGFLQNPTILDALETAGLSVNERSIRMVNAMMQEQMGIDKASLQEMARQLQNAPQIDMRTLVQLVRLNLPLTIETATQLEQYQQDRHQLQGQIQDAVEKVMQGLEVAAEDPKAVQIHQELLEIITNGDHVAKIPGEVISNETGQGSAAFRSKMQGEMAKDLGAIGQTKAVEVSREAEGRKIQLGPGRANAVVQNAEGIAGEAEGSVERSQKEVSQAVVDAREIASGKEEKLTESTTLENGISHFLDKEEVKELNEILNRAQKATSGRTVITGKMSTDQVMQQIQNILQEAGPKAAEWKQQLFLNGIYQKVLRHALEHRWSLQPEAVQDKGKVSDLYQRLFEQMEQIEKAFSALGAKAQDLTATTQNIRQNLEFMEQINQFFQYVQIPLQMKEGQVQSEFYVYTNRRAKSEEEELTAFLHLNLTHLGPLDISISKLQRHVDVQFYLEDSIARLLFERSMPQLQTALEERGYDCALHVQDRQADCPSPKEFFGQRASEKTGVMHRYSFDVKA